MVHSHRIEMLLQSQLTYYEARAGDYGDETKPDRSVPGMTPPAFRRALVDKACPHGDVLELACGTGLFTSEILRYARAITAVDASARMLAHNRQRINNAGVTYVHADIFRWRPDRVYDVVFFGFWLSHVPPVLFDDFWNLVHACLAPSGRVVFVDEDDRAAKHDERCSVGGVPAARRTLGDGRRFEIVKMFWRSEELEQRLRLSDWDINVQRAGDTFMQGVGKRR